jgi:hypothetical protein
VRYDAQSSKHQGLLRRLWFAAEPYLFQGVAPPQSLIDKLWKEMGWQVRNQRCACAHT